MPKSSARKPAKASQKKVAKTSSKPTKDITLFLNQTWMTTAKKANTFRSRRPHRSFRLTRRRDYIRSLALPGYFAFSGEVAGVLWKHKKLFGGLVIVYGLLSSVLVGVASQDSFIQVRSLIDETSRSILSGAWGEISKAGLIVATGISGTFTPTLTEGQQIYSGILVLMTWLTTVWLLRSILVGKIPRLRDGIYNAGSPVIATLLVALYMLLQAIPLVIAVLIAGALGTLGGAASMAFSIAALLLAVISFYWLTGSFMALIIVTLPGMYPWQAIRAAGDMVVGRRLRILLRLVWLIASIVMFWMVTVIPTVLFNNWLITVLPTADTWPIVPIVLLVVTSLVTVWASAYVYLLYRKVVDDDADPA